MSNKGPRRAKGVSGPAQSSAAHSMASNAFQDPTKVDALAGFLKGTFVAGPKSAEDGNPAASSGVMDSATAENLLPMHIRTLNKVSKATKSKALSELIRLVPLCTDSGLSGYAMNLVESFRQHAFHEDVQIRLQAYRMLAGLFETAGKATKQELAQQTTTLLGPWYCGTFDIERTVREAATTAWSTAFKTAEKEAVVQHKFGATIRTYCLRMLSDVVDEVGPKGLLDDHADANANRAHATLLALSSSLLKQHQLAASLPAAATAVPVDSGIEEVMGMLSPSGVVARIVPASGKFMSRTPRVRAALFEALANIINITKTVGIASPLDSASPQTQLLATAVTTSAADAHPAVAVAFWPFLLTWMKHYGSVAVAALPPNFSDTVLDIMDRCDDHQRSAVLAQSMLPFVVFAAKATADSTAAMELIDTFVGSMIERVKAIRERLATGGSASRQLELQALLDAWRAVLEIWELLAVRKQEAGEFTDALDALGVLVEVLVEHNLILSDYDPPEVKAIVPQATVKEIAGLITKSVQKAIVGKGLPADEIVGALFADDSEEQATIRKVRMQVVAAIAAGLVDIAAEPVVAFVATVKGRLSELAMWDEAVALGGASGTASPAQESVPASSGLASPVVDTEAAFASALLNFEKPPKSSLIPSMVTTALLNPATRSNLVRDVASGVASDSLNGAAKDAAIAVCVAIAEALELPEEASSSAAGAKPQVTDEDQKMLSTALPAIAFAGNAAAFTKVATTATAGGKSLSSDAVDAMMTVIGGLPVPPKVVIASSSDDDDDEEGSDVSSTGAYNSDDDDDEDLDDTATTMTTTRSARESAVTATKLLAWIEAATHLAAGIKEDAAALLCKKALDQVTHLAPMVLPETYLSDKFIGLVLRLDGVHQHRDATLSYVRAKTQAATVESFVELVHAVETAFGALMSEGSFAAALAELNASAQQAVAGAAVLNHGALLALNAHADLAAGLPSLLDPTRWDALCSAIEAEAGASSSAATRNLLRSIPEFDGDFSFAKVKLTVGAAGSALRLANVAIAAAELLAADESAVSHLTAESITVVVRAMALSNVFSAKTSAALQHILHAFLRVAADDLACSVLEALSPLHLITLAAKSGDKCATVLRLVVRRSLMLISRGASSRRWSSSLAHCAALIVAVRFLQRHHEEHHVPLASHAEDVATELHGILIAANKRQAGHSIEWLRVCVVFARTQPQKVPFRDDAAMPCIERAVAEKDDAAGALALLSDLSSCRIMNVGVYTELCSALKHVSGLVCTLHHLPTNGRLGQRIPTAGPLPVYVLRETTTAMIAVYGGLALHNRQDDVLLTNVYLAVTDTICEVISRLKTSSDDATSEIIRLVADCTPFVASLKSHETRHLSASEQTVTAIANALSSTHVWLASCSVAMIETIGVGRIAEIIRCVNSLAAVTLISAPVSCPDGVSAVTRRAPMRPIRTIDELSQPIKFQSLVQTQQSVHRSTKQSLCLHTHLMGWSAMLTIKGAFGEDTTPAQIKNKIYALLDLIAALALSPLLKDAPGGSIGQRLERSHWSHHPGDHLGFEIFVLGQLDIADRDESLARGALSVFTNLLTNTMTVPIVREWLETLDKQLRARIEGYVVAHVAPALMQLSLGEVLAESPDGEPTFELDEYVSVTVNVVAASIEVKFQQEEASVSVTLVLPPSFPLSTAEISRESMKLAVKGISPEKWRKWMLRMSRALFDGSLTLLECVKLFGENVTKHYDGVEPCPICYSVVASRTNKLPEMQCSVCSNKFHSTCLYQWWSSSSNSTCPMCRSPWYAK